MNKRFELVCIVCPLGCRLTLIKDESDARGYRIEGNACKRGEAYAIREMTNPTRVLATTVKINRGFLSRLPVRTDGEIPKGLLMKAMNIISRYEVEAPVRRGDVLIENILDTGVDVIATRHMKRQDQPE